MNNLVEANSAEEAQERYIERIDDGDADYNKVEYIINDYEQTN